MFIRHGQNELGMACLEWRVYRTGVFEEVAPNRMPWLPFEINLFV